MVVVNRCTHPVCRNSTAGFDIYNYCTFGAAIGITASDTRGFETRTNGTAPIPAGANPVLSLSITPNQHYTLTGVTVVAIATIEHQNGIPAINSGWGTREVVTDIRTWDNLNATGTWNDNYTVPTAYFESFYKNTVTGRMEIEVVLYADFKTH